MKGKSLWQAVFVMAAVLIAVFAVQPLVNEASAQQKNVILATTTSTQDSGLL
ncbi:MAG: hypothetical protein H6Q53_1390, partial [Deltaproteobacteria bacterium]|nr:hypothetical protein [Deltaproteobacteria bacterium]